jgi:hypothetical protein
MLPTDLTKASQPSLKRTSQKQPRLAFQVEIYGFDKLNPDKAVVFMVESLKTSLFS